MSRSTEKVKVSFYEDNFALRESYKDLFNVYDDYLLVGLHPNALNVEAEVSLENPDVIVMDIDMPGISGIEAVKIVHKRFPKIPILMHTVFDDDHKVFDSICAGAMGYLLKGTKPTAMLEAIKDAKSGGSPMTPVIANKVLKVFRQYTPEPEDAKIKLSDREKEVLTALTNGQSYKMISNTCKISIDTVRFHIRNIYEKLQVHSMTEAVSKALKERLI